MTWNKHRKYIHHKLEKLKKGKMGFCPHFLKVGAIMRNMIAHAQQQTCVNKDKSEFTLKYLFVIAILNLKISTHSCLIEMLRC